MRKRQKRIGKTGKTAAFLLAAAISLSGCGGSSKLTVSTEKLQPMNLQDTISTTGVVESQNGRKIYSTLSYPVEEVNVQVGDAVKEGDVLAKLKTSDLEIDIAQQQAAVDARKNQSAHQIEVSRKAYENAKNNYENGLNPNAISAEQGVLQAKNGVEQAKKQVESAEAAVRDAKEMKGVAADQINQQIEMAEQGLAVAQEGLATANRAYADAVQQQANAKAESDKVLAAEKVKMDEAQKEWDLYQRIHQADYEEARDEVSKAQDAVEKQEALIEEAKNNGADTTLLEAELKTLQSDLEAKERKFEIVKADRAPHKAEYDAQKAQYDAAVKAAEIEQNVYDQAINQANGAVIQAKGQVTGANAQVEMAENALSGPEMTQIEQGIGQASRGVDAAQLQEDMEKDQSKFAQQQKNASDNAIAQQIDSLQDNLIGSQIAAQSNAAQEIAIEKMKNTLNDATIESPVAGVVTAVYAKIGEPGNGLLFVVEDTNALQITTRIKESDIGKVKIGMPVTIKSDATGDQEIKGSVVEIAPSAVKTDNGTTKVGDKDSEVEFEAVVEVQDADSGLLIGMNTRLTILLEEKTNVLSVPYDSVVEKPDGTQVLYVAAQKEESEKSPYIVEEVPVSVGLETDFFVEVSGAGLEDGMLILSDPQSVVPGSEVVPDFAGEK